MLVLTSTFDGQDVAKSISHGIAESLKWKWQPDVKNYQVEIYINMSDEFIVVGFPIPKSEKDQERAEGNELDESSPKESSDMNVLSLRHYIKVNGMRSSLAWTMAHVAEIKEGQVILDPMCGKGTLLLESCYHWRNNVFIGFDDNSDKLQVARETIEYSKLCIQLHRGDARRLPLMEKSVDRIICDIPFGQKYSNYEFCKENYPKFLEEFFRITKDECKLVLLTAQQRLLEWNLERKFQNKWKLERKLNVRLGKTEATIFVIVKPNLEDQNATNKRAKIG
eukprot:TRINITY_DN5706_c0_g1_i1.p1 TRINITY_DN5706_c0_g1~~TRINITY_DN5706_c0_g1_i1.p1  ORF type:complete len:280 (-),score=74.50 TRINITY_DN5706_c0_g1_i1:85-924(-)